MPHPVLAAIAVLVEEGRVLLVRRCNPPDAGLWGYPGGKVEYRETIARAAARELAEETGVTAAPRAFLTLVDVIDTSPTASHHFVLAAMLCQRIAGTPVAADDVSEAAWQPVSDVLEGRLPTSDLVDDVLRLALAHREREGGARSA